MRQAAPGYWLVGWWNIMSDTQEIAQIRNKIMGALVADARASSGRSAQECAEILGISEASYADLESGQVTPALPQLEVLAYYFNVPVEHFWGTETVAVARKESEIKDSVPQFVALREKLIGATLRGLRDESDTTLEQLAEQTKVSVDRLEAFELGQQSIPVDELMLITRALNVSLDDLVDDHGTIGSWLRLQTEFDRFADLPDEVREFILKPINRSYLELAMRLSGLSVQRLRGIAEGILDITY
jgi:transcriptional regulator with XRE-family HTH domain